MPESLEDPGTPLEDPWKTPDGARFRQGFVKGHPVLIQGSSRAQNCGKTRILGMPKNVEIDPPMNRSLRLSLPTNRSLSLWTMGDAAPPISGASRYLYCTDNGNDVPKPAIRILRITCPHRVELPTSPIPLCLKTVCPRGSPNDTC